MAPARWWDEDPTQIYWPEITDRADLGVDLNAPLATEDRWTYPGYGFVREVREGDVVHHYRARPVSKITAWSRSVGEPYDDDVIWGAHGRASGRGPVTPYSRPGSRRPLNGPYALPTSVTLEYLRKGENPRSGRAETRFARATRMNRSSSPSSSRTAGRYVLLRPTSSSFREEQRKNLVADADAADALPDDEGCNFGHQRRVPVDRSHGSASARC